MLFRRGTGAVAAALFIATDMCKHLNGLPMFTRLDSAREDLHVTIS